MWKVIKGWLQSDKSSNSQIVIGPGFIKYFWSVSLYISRSLQIFCISIASPKTKRFCGKCFQAKLTALLFLLSLNSSLCWTFFLFIKISTWHGRREIITFNLTLNICLEIWKQRLWVIAWKEEMPTIILRDSKSIVKMVAGRYSHEVLIIVSEYITVTV